jgi:hypothetical protein
MKRMNTYIIIGVFILIGLSILTFISCKTDKKQTESDMKITITEKKEIGLKRLSFDSKSTEENGIINDITFVLNKINKEQLIKENQLLIYIDATNGNIFITGYIHETEKVFDNNGIAIEFQEYWEVVDNAGEFDGIIIESIIEALNSDIGKTTKENFRVYYQTEIDDAERIK